MQKVWHWLVGFIIQVYVIHITKKKDRAEVDMALYICKFSIFYTKCYYVTMLTVES